MKVFMEGDNVRLQLAEVSNGRVIRMCFDFKVPKNQYEELKNHIITHLNAFKVK